MIKLLKALFAFHVEHSDIENIYNEDGSALMTEQEAKDLILSLERQAESPFELAETKKVVEVNIVDHDVDEVVEEYDEKIRCIYCRAEGILAVDRETHRQFLYCEKCIDLKTLYCFEREKWICFPNSEVDLLSSSLSTPVQS